MISWRELALWGGAAIAILAIIATAFVKNDLRAERRLYWGGWLTLAICVTAAVWTTGWGGRIAIPLGCLLVATFRAWISTPYLKIGDRIYAASETHVQAEVPEHERKPLGPSAYSGNVKAATFWWMFAVMTAAFGWWVHEEGWYGIPAFGVAMLAVLATAMGIDDATRKLLPVRGQRIQGFVIMVASIPMFGAPPIGYVIGYQIGQRKPMGKGKHARP